MSLAENKTLTHVIHCNFKPTLFCPLESMKEKKGIMMNKVGTGFFLLFF